MIKIIILFGAAYLLLRALMPRQNRNPNGNGRVSGRSDSQIDDVMIQDPVCEAYFPQRSGVHLIHEGKDYYFCSTECRDKFIGTHDENG